MKSVVHLLLLSVLIAPIGVNANETGKAEYEHLFLTQVKHDYGIMLRNPEKATLHGNEDRHDHNNNPSHFDETEKKAHQISDDVLNDAANRLTFCHMSMMNALPANLTQSAYMVAKTGGTFEEAKIAFVNTIKPAMDSDKVSASVAELMQKAQVCVAEVYATAR